MFVPVVFDVGAICPAAPPCTGAAAMSSLVADGASQSAQALSGANGSTMPTVSLGLSDGDYNNTAAPHNCVGSTGCQNPPFSGSPWTVPAPQHWYATAPSGAEGMAPSQALAAAPFSLPAAQEPRVVFGPQPKPNKTRGGEQDSEAPEMGPPPKPPSLALGLCSIHSPQKGGQGFIAAWEQVWAKKAEEGKNDQELHGIRPTPGHAIMCGHALLLGAASTILTFGCKTISGEATSPDDVAREFKESATCHAEAVTPIGGHWLRHHVLKPESALEEVAL
jgi:hypothetical protein